MSTNMDSQLNTSDHLNQSDREKYGTIIGQVLNRILERMLTDDTYLPGDGTLRELRHHFPPLTVDPAAVAAYVRAQIRYHIDVVEYVLIGRFGSEQAHSIIEEIRSILLPDERRALLEAGDTSGFNAIATVSSEEVSNGTGQAD